MEEAVVWLLDVNRETMRTYSQRPPTTEDVQKYGSSLDRMRDIQNKVLNNCKRKRVGEEEKGCMEWRRTEEAGQRLSVSAGGAVKKYGERKTDGRMRRVLGHAHAC
ncbi:hypothetical protein AcV5_004530 [Taiwanofungus camphoratus]|nr:hypothetical protein AcV5_004530 [Antrodia cinnamomea]KAI0961585.1 hypothetical protein AcV7_000650 [Antrodia cinnamomea]